MRHVAVLFLAAVALLFPPHASSVGEGPWECLWGTNCTDKSLLPTASAYVTDDCTRSLMTPCFETICGRADGADTCAADSAVAYVQSQTDSGLRVVNVYPKSDGTPYSEDILLCFANEGGTGTSTAVCTQDGSGFTVLRGVIDNNYDTIAVVPYAGNVMVAGISDDTDHPTLLMTDAALVNMTIRGSADYSESTLVTGTNHVGSIMIRNAQIAGLGAYKVLGAGHTIAHFAFALGQVSVLDTLFYGIQASADADSTVVLFDAGTGTKSASGFTWIQNSKVFADWFSGDTAGASALKFVNTTGQVEMSDIMIGCGNKANCIEVDDQNVTVSFNDVQFAYNPAKDKGRTILLTDRDGDDFTDATKQCADPGGGAMFNYVGGGGGTDDCPASLIRFGSMEGISTDFFTYGPDLWTANNGMLNETHIIGSLNFTGAAAGDPANTASFDDAGEKCWPGWTFIDTTPAASGQAMWVCGDDGDGDGSPGTWMPAGQGSVVSLQTGATYTAGTDDSGELW